MNETEEKKDPITEKVAALPKDVRDAIFSVEIGKKITEVSQKYKLHIDKAEILSNETGLVMLGLTHPKDYANNLKKRLEITDDMAELIVGEINEHIFKPIRESLKKIHNLAEKDELITNNLQPATKSKTENTTYSPTGQAGNLQPTLGEEDKKILKDSGIEIQLGTKSQELSEEESIKELPKRADVLEALENPSSVSKDTVTMPGGYSFVNKSPEPAPAGQKSPAPVVAPSQITLLKTEIPTEKPAIPVNETKKQSVDPYREPII